MNVTFLCPCCEQTAQVEVADDAAALACPRCHAESEISPSVYTQGNLSRCLVCPSSDLFLRKDFPQRLGVVIVLIGFAGFLISNYFYHLYVAFGFLFGTAAIDVLLFLFVGDALVCYRCGAHYRDVKNLDKFGSFQLETHERYRQLAARLAEKKGMTND